LTAKPCSVLLVIGVVRPKIVEYLVVCANTLWLSSLEIGDIAGVAEVTITKSYKLMRPKAADLFPEGFVFSVHVDMLPMQ